MRAATTTAQPTAEATEDELVRSHLPLVHHAVAEVAGRVPGHIGRDDLTSAGMIGLAQAARSYQPARGIPFGRFATARIRGALLDELRSRDWASRSVRTKARAVAATTERLSSEIGRSPTIEEVADAMGVAARAVESIAADVQRAVVLNLDALPGDGKADEIALVAEGTPDDAVLAEEQRRTMMAAIASLPERLRRVVVGCFFQDLPMQVLAGELGVTESRISQMRTEALGLLRDGINSQLDPDAVEDRRRIGRVARRKQAYYAAIAAHPAVRRRRPCDAVPHLQSVA